MSWFPGPNIGDDGLPEWSRGDVPTRAPFIEGFESVEAGAGDLITVLGEQLHGAAFLVGEMPARLRHVDRHGATLAVPPVGPGEYEVAAFNEFGFHVAAHLLTVVESSNRITYRGDAVGWQAAGGHSIVPSAANQPVLVLVCQAPDVGLPSGTTDSSIRQLVQQKLDGATDSVNAFWREATYGKTSFAFTIHNQVLTLPNNLAHYFQNSRARRIDASGALYPLTWTGGETLTLLGDEGTVAVTFTAGPQGVAQVATTIDQAIRNASADPSDPPLRATVAGGQLRLETTTRSAQAVLDVTGGTARANLGFEPSQTTVTVGLDGVANRQDFVHHALDRFLAGRTNAQARQTMNAYAGVLCPLAHNTTSNLLRAYANSVQTYNFQGGGQAHFSDVVITTGYPWTTWAHEFGHCLGLADLYDESGKQAGIEPDLLDIMGPRHYGVEAHPLAWAKHWRSRQPASGGGYTLQPWLDDQYVTTITAPATGATRSWEVILTPIETDYPTVNPFASTHPGASLRQAVRIELSDDYAFYLENRQRPYSAPQFGTSHFDSDLPATGVFVTSAVDRDSTKLFRVFCVLETPPTNPLDTVNEEWEHYVTATNRIRVRLVEVLGASPLCYRVLVTWGDVSPATGTKLDLRITDWSPPPWETPDIWVDTEVDNAWGEYTHSDAAKNPNVAGHPVRCGDRLQEKQSARLYARVWNDGSVDKVGARVQFRIVKPAGMGPNPGIMIGEAPPVDVPAGHYAVAGPVAWAPMNVDDCHVCVRAFVVADPAETDHANNAAQENFSDWYVPQSSPYELVERPFQVTNPLPRRALVQMRATGLEPGFNMTVEPHEFWLHPDETRRGRLVLETEDHVMLEDARVAEEQPQPLVGLGAWVLRGCTFVPFGGLSGMIHTVRRTRLEMAIDPAGDGFDVTGMAATADGPFAGGQVTVRLAQADGVSVRSRERTRTGTDGRFHVHLPRGRPTAGPWEEFLLLDAWLSPAPGYAPANAGPVQVD